MAYTDRSGHRAPVKKKKRKPVPVAPPSRGGASSKGYADIKPPKPPPIIRPPKKPSIVGITPRDFENPDPLDRNIVNMSKAYQQRWGKIPSAEQARVLLENTTGLLSVKEWGGFFAPGIAADPFTAKIMNATYEYFDGTGLFPSSEKMRAMLMADVATGGSGDFVSFLPKDIMKRLPRDVRDRSIYDVIAREANDKNGVRLGREGLHWSKKDIASMPHAPKTTAEADKMRLLANRPQFALQKTWTGEAYKGVEGGERITSEDLREINEARAWYGMTALKADVTERINNRINLSQGLINPDGTTNTHAARAFSFTTKQANGSLKDPYTFAYQRKALEGRNRKDLTPNQIADLDAIGRLFASIYPSDFSMPKGGFVWNADMDMIASRYMIEKNFATAFMANPNPEGSKEYKRIEDHRDIAMINIAIATHGMIQPSENLTEWAKSMGFQGNPNDPGMFADQLAQYSFESYVRTNVKSGVTTEQALFQFVAVYGPESLPADIKTYYDGLEKNFWNMTADVKSHFASSTIGALFENVINANMYQEPLGVRDLEREEALRISKHGASSEGGTPLTETQLDEVFPDRLMRTRVGPMPQSETLHPLVAKYVDPWLLPAVNRVGKFFSKDIDRYYNIAFLLPTLMAEKPGTHHIHPFTLNYEGTDNKSSKHAEEYGGDGQWGNISHFCATFNPLNVAVPWDIESYSASNINKSWDEAQRRTAEVGSHAYVRTAYENIGVNPDDNPTLTFWTDLAFQLGVDIIADRGIGTIAKLIKLSTAAAARKLLTPGIEAKIAAAEKRLAEKGLTGAGEKALKQAGGDQARLRVGELMDKAEELARAGKVNEANLLRKRAGKIQSGLESPTTKFTIGAKPINPLQDPDFITIQMLKKPHWYQPISYGLSRSKMTGTQVEHILGIDLNDFGRGNRAEVKRLLDRMGESVDQDEVFEIMNILNVRHLAPLTPGTLMVGKMRRLHEIERPDPLAAYRLDDVFDVGVRLEGGAKDTAKMVFSLGTLTRCGLPMGRAREADKIVWSFMERLHNLDHTLPDTILDGKRQIIWNEFQDLVEANMKKRIVSKRTKDSLRFWAKRAGFDMSAFDEFVKTEADAFRAYRYIKNHKGVGQKKSFSFGKTSKAWYDDFDPEEVFFLPNKKGTSTGQMSKDLVFHMNAQDLIAYQRGKAAGQMFQYSPGLGTGLPLPSYMGLVNFSRTLAVASLAFPLSAVGIDELWRLAPEYLRGNLSIDPMARVIAMRDTKHVAYKVGGQDAWTEMMAQAKVAIPITPDMPQYRVALNKFIEDYSKNDFFEEFVAWRKRMVDEGFPIEEMEPGELHEMFKNELIEMILDPENAMLREYMRQTNKGFTRGYSKKTGWDNDYITPEALRAQRAEWDATSETVERDVRAALNEKEAVAKELSDYLATSITIGEVPEELLAWMYDNGRQILDAVALKDFLSSSGREIVEKQALKDWMRADGQRILDATKLRAERAELQKQLDELKAGVGAGPLDVSKNADGSVTITGFHGTRGEIGKGSDFGGVHIGTEKAATQRLADTEVASRLGGVPGPDTSKILPVKVTLKKPLGTAENPISETDLFILNGASKAKVAAAGNKSMEDLLAEGYDGIIYQNIKEDPGSISVQVFDRASPELKAAPAATPSVDVTKEKELLAQIKAKIAEPGYDGTNRARYDAAIEDLEKKIDAAEGAQTTAPTGMDVEKLPEKLSDIKFRNGASLGKMSWAEMAAEQARVGSIERQLLDTNRMTDSLGKRLTRAKADLKTALGDYLRRGGKKRTGMDVAEVKWGRSSGGATLSKDGNFIIERTTDAGQGGDWYHIGVLDENGDTIPHNNSERSLADAKAWIWENQEELLAMRTRQAAPTASKAPAAAPDMPAPSGTYDPDFVPVGKKSRTIGQMINVRYYPKAIREMEAGAAKKQAQLEYKAWIYEKRGVTDMVEKRDEILTRREAAVAALKEKNNAAKAHYDTPYPKDVLLDKNADAWLDASVDKLMLWAVNDKLWNATIRGTRKVGPFKRSAIGPLELKAIRADLQSKGMDLPNIAGAEDSTTGWIRSFGRVGHVPIVSKFAEDGLGPIPGPYQVLNFLSNKMRSHCFIGNFTVQYKKLIAIGYTHEDAVDAAVSRAQKYVDRIMYSPGSTPVEHDLAGVFMFLPAYRQAIQYWSREFLRDPLVYNTLRQNFNEEMPIQYGAADSFMQDYAAFIPIPFWLQNNPAEAVIPGLAPPLLYPLRFINTLSGWSKVETTPEGTPKKDKQYKEMYTGATNYDWIAKNPVSGILAGFASKNISPLTFIDDLLWGILGESGYGTDVSSGDMSGSLWKVFNTAWIALRKDPITRTKLTTNILQAQISAGDAPNLTTAEKQLRGAPLWYRVLQTLGVQQPEGIFSAFTRQLTPRKLTYSPRDIGEVKGEAPNIGAWDTLGLFKNDEARTMADADFLFMEALGNDEKQQEILKKYPKFAEKQAFYRLDSFDKEEKLMDEKNHWLIPYVTGKNSYGVDGLPISNAEYLWSLTTGQTRKKETQAYLDTVGKLDLSADWSVVLTDLEKQQKEDLKIAHKNVIALINRYTTNPDQKKQYLKTFDLYEQGRLDETPGSEYRQGFQEPPFWLYSYARRAGLDNRRLYDPQRIVLAFEQATKTAKQAQEWIEAQDMSSQYFRGWPDKGAPKKGQLPSGSIPRGGVEAWYTGRDVENWDKGLGVGRMLRMTDAFQKYLPEEGRDLLALKNSSSRGAIKEKANENKSFRDYRVMSILGKESYLIQSAAFLIDCGVPISDVGRWNDLKTDLDDAYYAKKAVGDKYGTFSDEYDVALGNYKKKCRSLFTSKKYKAVAQPLKDGPAGRLLWSDLVSPGGGRPFNQAFVNSVVSAMKSNKDTIERLVEGYAPHLKSTRKNKDIAANAWASVLSSSVTYRKMMAEVYNEYGGYNGITPSSNAGKPYVSRIQYLVNAWKRRSRLFRRQWDDLGGDTMIDGFLDPGF